MRKNSQALRSDHEVVIGVWDRYWFSGAPVAPISMIRGLLAIIALLYFVSAWPDAIFWYGEGGVLSRTHVSELLRTGGLEGTGSWIISPLFLAEASWVYQLYLLVGIAMGIFVFLGRGGRWASFLLWCLFVGWANRAMLLSGLAETLLSLGLFAAAISPAGYALSVVSPKRKTGLGTGSEQTDDHWTAGFAQRLLATQITLIGIVTWVTMLGGRIWFNGLGAYALAAPVEDRTIDWTTPNSLLVQAPVHEFLTHMLVITLPLGLFFSWLPKYSSVGKLVLIGWCVVVGMLASHWLYAFTFAVLCLSIRPLGKACKDESVSV